MGKLKYNTEDYQNAAITAEKELLKIPVITLRQSTKTHDSPPWNPGNCSCRCRRRLPAQKWHHTSKTVNRM